MGNIIKFNRYDQEEKTTYCMEYEREDLHNYLLGTMEKYLDDCKDDIQNRTDEEKKAIIDRWDKEFAAKEDPIKAAISDHGAFLQIRLSIFDKIEITLDANKEYMTSEYECINIVRIHCHPDYLEFGYQVVNAIDHVAWVLGSRETEYQIINPDLLEVGLLYYNGYEKDAVDPEKEIYLVKHQFEDHGYKFRNERQARDVSPEAGE